jgi:hypothetical protein
MVELVGTNNAQLAVKYVIIMVNRHWAGAVQLLLRDEPSIISGELRD